MRLNAYMLPVLYALLGTSFLAVVAFPGFMSYDSVHMVEEARTSVEGGIFPTMPVYIFRVFDIFGNGNAIQFLIQNFVVIVCFNLILVRVSIQQSVIFMVNALILSNPLTMGAMLVLWKDVTLLALVLLVLLALVWQHTEHESQKSRHLIKWVVLVLIFIIAGMKLNALPMAFGLLIYWAYLYYPHVRFTLRALTVIGLTTSAFLVTMVLQTVGFPELNRLKDSGNVTILMASDLLGISQYAGESLVPFASQVNRNPVEMPMSDINKIYTNYGILVMQQNAENLGVPLRLFPESYTDEDLRKAWIAAVLTYPVEYAQYRLDIFGAIIGSTVSKTYEPTHFAKIDPNSLGITFPNRAITDITLLYIDVTSGIWLFMPATVFVAATALVTTITVRSRRHLFVNKLSMATYVLAVIYLIPYLILPGTGEVRYAYPSTMLLMMSMACAVAGIRRLDAQASLEPRRAAPPKA